MNPSEKNIFDAYTRWHYDRLVWKQSYWHGVRTLKLPSDMWNYQEIIFDRNIDWIIETGTRHGGSALFLAETLISRNAAGVVVSIDIESDSRHVASHDRIHFLIGDSSSIFTAAAAMSLVPEDRGPMMIILDSDHSKNHVFQELELWVPILSKGDTLIVEDTIINGHPVRPDFGPGPHEAVEEFLTKYPDQLIHDQEREEKFGITSCRNGYYIKA